MGTQAEVQKDPFDDENFDPIKYINEIFPNEESLENLDTIMGNVKKVVFYHQFLKTIKLQNRKLTILIKTY